MLAGQVLVTFNSLSRDHVNGLLLGRLDEHDTFNSLSRDHAKQFEGMVKQFAALSTPSLGIT